MKFGPDPRIVEAQKAYLEAKAQFNRICLEVEKDCKHEIWGGVDSSGRNSLGAVYICLGCRMEVHIRSANYTSFESSPDGSLVLSANQCRVGDVLQLRLQGDDRRFINKQYSSDKTWPVRQPEPAKELA